MLQAMFTFAKPVVIALGVVLLTVAQGQAASPASGSSPTGGRHHHHGFHHGRGFPVNFGFYGYPYSNLDYAYTIARERQYRAALLQAEQYRAAVLQLQWSASQRAQADQLRSPQAQPTTPQSSQAARVAPRRAPASPEVVLTSEDRATAKLKMATIFAEDGQAADAADYFREIVQKYPGTLAARQAQQSLANAYQR